MSDIVVTPANVKPADNNNQVETGYAGVAILAGQSCYYEASSGTYKLAKANVLAQSAGRGVALNTAGIGQPITVFKGGNLNPGAALTIGLLYVVSGANAGGLAPSSDLVSGWFPTFVGVATAVNNLFCGVLRGGVALP